MNRRPLRHSMCRPLKTVWISVSLLTRNQEWLSKLVQRIWLTLISMTHSSPCLSYAMLSSMMCRGLPVVAISFLVKAQLRVPLCKPLRWKNWTTVRFDRALSSQQSDRQWRKHRRSKCQPNKVQCSLFLQKAQNSLSPNEHYTRAQSVHPLQLSLAPCIAYPRRKVWKSDTKT